MQQIFIVAALRPDENMWEESAHMFSHLYKIVNFHSRSGIFKITVIRERINWSIASKEPGKEFSIFD